MSGLTGSAGIAVVLADKAILATDGRYCLQSNIQVYCNWDISCPGGEAEAIEYILANTNAGDLIGANPLLFTQSAWDRYSDALATKSVILQERNIYAIEHFSDHFRTTFRSLLGHFLGPL